MRNLWINGLVGCCLFGLGVSTVQAQDWLWPVEIEQGLTLIDGVDPYRASLRLHPTLAFRKRTLRIGATVAAAYTNPKFALQGGGRLSAQVWSFSILNQDLVRLHTAFEGLWERDGILGTTNRSIGALSLTLDLDGLLHLGVRGGHDFAQEHWRLGAWVGLDLSVFSPPEDEDPFEE